MQIVQGFKAIECTDVYSYLTDTYTVGKQLGILKRMAVERTVKLKKRGECTVSKKSKKALKPQQYKAIALMVYKDVNGLTNEDIAKEVGVNPSTLYEWKKREDFNAELLAQAEEVQRSFLADTYTQLRVIINSKKVNAGNKLKAIELVLKNQGRLKEVQETTVKADDKDINTLLKELNTL
ncbi:phBC6A51 family helix-turn-helix protein [Rummeliibacillus stabekisii]|uniref:phBC6A51 family helix-turn-helix protein n=1 Tax=Rummeliibacillus stabekisii TaxID=241244 RepID=UPI00370FB18C